jgi:hypothetical protein
MDHDAGFDGHSSTRMRNFHIAEQRPLLTRSFTRPRRALNLLGNLGGGARVAEDRGQPGTRLATLEMHFWTRVPILGKAAIGCLQNPAAGANAPA